MGGSKTIVKSFKAETETSLATQLEDYLQTESVADIYSFNPYSVPDTYSTSGSYFHCAILIHGENSSDEMFKEGEPIIKKNEWDWADGLKDILRDDTQVDELVKSKKFEVESGNRILIMTMTKDKKVWERLPDIPSAAFVGEFLKYNPMISDRIIGDENLKEFLDLIKRLKSGKSNIDIYRIEITERDGNVYFDIFSSNYKSFSYYLTPF